MAMVGVDYRSLFRLFPEQVHSNVVFSQDLEHFNQEYHEDNI